MTLGDGVSVAQNAELSGDNEVFSAKGHYVFDKEIGRGAFARVVRVKDDNGVDYAVKILNKSYLKRRMIAKNKSAWDDAQREVAILKKLKHNNVVAMHEVIDDPVNDKMYIVMEYVEGGTSVSDARRLANESIDEDSARQMFRGLVMGMEYIHYQGIIHRDIKPENLLKDGQGVLKIADFGVSAIIGSLADVIGLSRKTSVYGVGTPAFSSPEAVSGNKIGPPADIWSAGATLYYFLFGRPPFQAKRLPDLWKKIRKGSLKFPDKTVSKSARQLLKQMMAKDASSRITIAQLKQHPWVTRDGEEPLPRQVLARRINVSEEEVREGVYSLASLVSTKQAMKMLLTRARKKLDEKRKRTAGKRAEEQARRTQVALQQQYGLLAGPGSELETFMDTERATGYQLSRMISTEAPDGEGSPPESASSQDASAADVEEPSPVPHVMDTRKSSGRRFVRAGSLEARESNAGKDSSRTDDDSRSAKSAGRGGKGSAVSTRTDKSRAGASSAGTTLARRGTSSASSSSSSVVSSTSSRKQSAGSHSLARASTSSSSSSRRSSSTLGDKVSRKGSAASQGSESSPASGSSSTEAVSWTAARHRGSARLSGVTRTAEIAVSVFNGVTAQAVRGARVTISDAGGAMSCEAETNDAGVTVVRIVSDEFPRQVLVSAEHAELSSVREVPVVADAPMSSGHAGVPRTMVALALAPPPEDGYVRAVLAWSPEHCDADLFVTYDNGEQTRTQPLASRPDGPMASKYVDVRLAYPGSVQWHVQVRPWSTSVSAFRRNLSRSRSETIARRKSGSSEAGQMDAYGFVGMVGTVFATAVIRSGGDVMLYKSSVLEDGLTPVWHVCTMNMEEKLLNESDQWLASVPAADEDIGDADVSTVVDVGLDERISRLEDRLGHQFSADEGEHCEMLLRLWTNVRPTWKLQSVKSKYWRKLGFPTDNAGKFTERNGMVFLEHLLYLSVSYEDRLRKMLDYDNGAFPVAYAGSLTTTMLASLLTRGKKKRLRNDALRKKKEGFSPDELASRVWALSTMHEQAFDEIYAICMREIFRLYVSTKAKPRHLPVIVSTMYRRFATVLASDELKDEMPRTLEDLEIVLVSVSSDATLRLLHCDNDITGSSNSVIFSVTPGASAVFAQTEV